MTARTPTTPTASAQTDQPGPPAELEDIILLPGLFHGWELKPVVMSSPNFRVQEAGWDPAGEPLFAVYACAIDARRREPSANHKGALHESPVVEPPDADELCAGDMDVAHDAQSLGELTSRHREEHLCFRCLHQHVCGMATGLAPEMLVTISSCLGFRPAEPDEPCELMPIEPLPVQ